MNVEGTRRLSLFLGTMGSIGWILYVLIATNFFYHKIDMKGWVIITAGIPFCFAVPYGLVKGIAWVHNGFKSK